MDRREYLPFYRTPSHDYTYQIAALHDEEEGWLIREVGGDSKEVEVQGESGEWQFAIYPASTHLCLKEA